MSERIKDLSDNQKIERNSESFNFRNLLAEGIAEFANTLNKQLDKDISQELKITIFESTFKECIKDVVDSLKWSKGYIDTPKKENAKPK